MIRTKDETLYRGVLAARDAFYKLAALVPEDFERDTSAD